MKRLFLITVVALSLPVALSQASAKPQAPISGKDAAQMLCSRCHDTVSPKVRNGTLGSGAPPAFSLIAQDQRMTDNELRRFLRLPHGRMAVLTLTQGEIDALIVYIKSFKSAQD